MSRISRRVFIGRLPNGVVMRKFSSVLLLVWLLVCCDRVVAESPTTQPAETLTVATVQMRSTRDLVDNLNRTTAFISTAAKRGARVVVFPECNITGYFDDAARAATQQQLQDAERFVALACQQNNVYAIVGMPWRENDKLFNSAIIISPQGQVIERYHKVQLAEEWPDPGDHLSMYHIDGVPCTTIICHDERYPELVRLPVLSGAQVVFYISHESGIRSENKIGPYRAQIQARAVENGVFVVQANAPANLDTTGSNGHSRIIAPDGNILQEASIFGEDILIEPLDIKQARRGNAIKSLRSDVTRDWWQEGMKLVRIIE
jgi:predicted amidohydrolase